MNKITNIMYDKLELAIDRYVDGLDMDDLIQIVTDDLWTYYRKSADLDTYYVCEAINEHEAVA